MSFHTFIVFYSVITAAFGMGLIILPEQVFFLYGISANAPLRLTAQLFGAALLSLALMGWYIRGTDSGVRRGVLTALLVGELAGLVLAINGQMHAVMNVLGWSVVGVYALLTVGLAYFRFGRV